MSTLLYVQNDGLYADSRHLFNAFGLVRANQDKTKIKLSDDGTFIWGYTGFLFTHDLKLVEEGIRKWLKEVYLYNKHIEVEVPEYTIYSKILKRNINPPIFDGTAFIVTKKQAWYITQCKDNQTKSEMCANLMKYNLPYAGTGTGGLFAEGIMRVTANPLYALEQAIKYDTVSGGPIQRVGFESLKEAKDY